MDAFDNREIGAFCQSSVLVFKGRDKVNLEVEEAGISLEVAS
ncbi:hypothetical protein TDIS_1732 [Thermosulfurimonas dismutans]|uniref:Uncharacterized protein n=1 Tax=Thermosulfurimonas dismutans TaxID=999894 RepID=A0A179D2E6_9BACT|nr:hypothetical protein TDIS_1732 [Thermosulfurimonas dismutans]